MGHTVETLIVDQNGLFRDGLCRLLQDTRYKPVYSSDIFPEQYITSIPGQNLSLVIIGPDAGHTIPLIFEHQLLNRSCRVVVLMSALSEQRNNSGYRAGADAFLLATMSIDMLVKSLDLVMEGLSIVPSDRISLLSPKLGLAEDDLISTTVRTPGPSQTANLSAREMLVLQSLMAGASNKTIGRDIGIAEATVKVHVKAIFRKACLRNRTQVALWAAQQQDIGGALWSSRPELTFRAPPQQQPGY